MNLQQRSVRSKHMRHDGAMTNTTPEVWAGATSLKSAKAALCAAIDSPRSAVGSAMSEDEEREECMKSRSSYRERRVWSAPRSAVGSAMSEDEEGEECEKPSSSYRERRFRSKRAMKGKKEKKSRSIMSAVSSFFGAAKAADESDASSRASSVSGDRETVRAAPVIRHERAVARSWAAPKTLGTNVLEED